MAKRIVKTKSLGTNVRYIKAKQRGAHFFKALINAGYSVIT
jgi:hypothetical protein